MFLVVLNYKVKYQQLSININKHYVYFSNNIKVTASFGIYECKEQNPTKCLSKADNALYEAKNSSRNCVKIFLDNKN